jgi:hypothetical protein
MSYHKTYLTVPRAGADLPDRRGLYTH